MKLPPPAAYASSTSRDWSSFAVQPNTLPPRQSGNTSRSVRPSRATGLTLATAVGKQSPVLGEHEQPPAAPDRRRVAEALGRSRYACPAPRGRIPDRDVPGKDLLTRADELAAEVERDLGRAAPQDLGAEVVERTMRDRGQGERCGIDEIAVRADRRRVSAGAAPDLPRSEQHPRPGEQRLGHGLVLRPAAGHVR